MTETAPLLRVTHLTMRFDGLLAVDDLSFAANSREIVAIIGPNGAGKTTVFNCLTGFYKPAVGQITLTLPGQPPILLERLDDFRIAQKARVVRTFQNVRIFPKMSVLENLAVAQHNRLMRASGQTVLGFLGTASYARAETEAIELARYWLARTGLEARADGEAGALSYGEQRRLEIARAMCCDPVLLCLDEPAAGLNPRETSDLGEIITFIRDEHGIGILLIEHDMQVVMGISNRVVVLEHGRKIADAPPGQVRNDPAVIRAYLGTEDDEDGEDAA